jgi:hypothetical protein
LGRLIGILFFGTLVLGAALQEIITRATIAEGELIAASNWIAVHTAGALLCSIWLCFALGFAASADITIYVIRFVSEHML